MVLLFAQRTTAPAVVTMDEAFRREIERSYEGPVDLHVEYLDIPDDRDTVYRDRLVDLLRAKYQGQPVGVVVAVRLESLRFTLEHRQQVFGGAPIVFVDVTRGDVRPLALPPDATGVLRELTGQETVNIALDLCPEARRVVVVCGTSEVDEGNEAYVRRLVEARSPGLEVLSMRGLALEEQLRRVSQLPRDSVVIFTGYRTDLQGRSTIPFDILRLVARASSAPVFGSSETYLGEGIVGGDLVRYRPQAEGAARLAARILRGDGAASVPPVDVQSSQPMFDWRELRRWGIPESRLPQGSVVLFREPNLWAEHWRAFLLALGVLVGQTVLIGALLLSRRRRVAAEAGLRDAEQRYRTVADFTHDWEYWGRPDETFAYVSPSCLGMTGYTADEFYRRPALLNEIVLPEDRPRWLEHSRIALSETQATPPLEIRIVRADGEVRWIDHVCTPVTGEDGRPAGLRGSNRDITDKKRSEEALRHALAEIERLRERLEADNTYLREQVEPEPGFEGIVGRSDALRYVLAKVQQVAPATTTVLLQGETGVGKDLVAHALHSLSPRAKRAPRQAQLRRPAPVPRRERALRPREGLLHRGDRPAQGAVRDRRRQHPLPRRDRRAAARAPGQAAAGDPGRGVRARGRLGDPEGGRAPGRRHEPSPGRGGEGGALPPGPLVPPERLPDHGAAAAPAPRGHAHARPALRRQALPAPGPDDARGLGRHPDDLAAQEWPGNVRELESVIERAVLSSPGPALRVADLGDRARRRGAFADAPGRPDTRTLEENERDHIVATLERTVLAHRGRGRRGRAARHQPEHPPQPDPEARHRPARQPSGRRPWPYLTGRFSTTAKPFACSSCSCARRRLTRVIQISRVFAAASGGVSTGTVSAFQFM